MKPKRSIDMTTGSVMKKLISFTLPILATNLLQHLYHAADKAVVGNFAENGKVALAAVGATGAATNLVVNLFIGLSLGANIVCANLRGGKHFADLRRCMHTALLVAVADVVEHNVVYLANIKGVVCRTKKLAVALCGVKVGICIRLCCTVIVVVTHCVENRCRIANFTHCGAEVGYVVVVVVPEKVKTAIAHID